MTTRSKYDRVNDVLNNIYTISSIVAGVASVAIVAVASAREQQGKRRRLHGSK
jgi:heme/copper-type cytochrome/quinol oxidase subunit 2